MQRRRTEILAQYRTIYREKKHIFSLTSSIPPLRSPQIWSRSQFLLGTWLGVRATAILSLIQTT